MQFVCPMHNAVLSKQSYIIPEGGAKAPDAKNKTNKKDNIFFMMFTVMYLGIIERKYIFCKDYFYSWIYIIYIIKSFGSLRIKYEK